jgi:RNA polymerase sigma-70 factor (ECF subfamily)
MSVAETLSVAAAEPVPMIDHPEQRLIARLRAGDEAAFAELVDRYHQSLIRLAMSYVSSRAVAEEVVQETWLAVVQGIDRFAGRSSLKTWLYSIVMNLARRRGQREARSVPFSALASAASEGDEPAVDPDRFLGAGSAEMGHWASPPPSWGEAPEERLLAGETQAVIAQAIEGLPPNQRAVILLRDVHGCGSEEVCNILKVSETNQRVLLHRARSKVRGALERYLAEA